MLISDKWFDEHGFNTNKEPFTNNLTATKQKSNMQELLNILPNSY